LRYVTGHPVHFLRNYFVKVYNAFRYPRHGPAQDPFRDTLIVLGLVGLVWFAVAEWGRPRWIMLPIFCYYVAFTALFHITMWGRINLPMKVLLSFFAAYLVTTVGARAIGLAIHARPGA
jgi:hypothetical protein